MPGQITNSLKQMSIILQPLLSHHPPSAVTGTPSAIKQLLRVIAAPYLPWAKCKSTQCSERINHKVC